MSDLPQGFTAGDLYVYAYGPKKDGTFGYIPAAPSVEVIDEAPQASLLTSVQGAVLALQAVWTADPDAVNAAQKEVASRNPDVSFPHLRAAELSDVTASLSVTGVDGETATFGPRETSGSESYRAVFNEQLKSSEKLAVLSAFRGQGGVLKLAYSGTLKLQESVAIEIAGNLAQDVKALAPPPPKKKGGIFGKKDPSPPVPPPDLAAAAKSVDDAIAGGRLRVTCSETPNVSAASRSKVETRVRSEIAKLLLDKVVEMGADAEYLSSFEVRKTDKDSERIEFPVSGAADLGALLAGYDASRLITEAGVPLPDRQG